MTRSICTFTQVVKLCTLSTSGDDTLIGLIYVTPKGSKFNPFAPHFGPDYAPSKQQNGLERALVELVLCALDYAPFIVKKRLQVVFMHLHKLL